jgi:hypothetical protein
MCKYYKTDGTCDECNSGITFDPVKYICPCNDTYTRSTLKNGRENCILTTTYENSFNCKYF